MPRTKREPIPTDILQASDIEFADYLLMVADDLEESGMAATADDYRECARRLKA